VLPTVVVTARDLWQDWSTRPKPALDPNADSKTQVASIAERLSRLESVETEQAKLVSQMAEQLQAIAKRVTVCYWLGLSGVALGVAAVVLAILR